MLKGERYRGIPPPPPQNPCMISYFLLVYANLFEEEPQLQGEGLAHVAKGRQLEEGGDRVEVGDEDGAAFRGLGGVCNTRLVRV